MLFFNTESTEDTESVLEERDLEFDKRSRWLFTEISAQIISVK